MSMKRILTIAVLFCLLLTLAACQKGNAPLTSAVDAGSDLPPVTTEREEADDTSKTRKTEQSDTDDTGQETKTTKLPTATRTTKSRKTRATTSGAKGYLDMTQDTTTTAKKYTTARPAKPTAARTYPADRLLRVACVGDSITAGGYWENNLQGTLPADRYKVFGYGVSGATGLYSGLDWNSATGAFDVPKAYRKEQKYEDSLAAGADIVIVMLGTNDSKDYNWNQLDGDPTQFIYDMTDLVRSYQQSDSAPTVLIALPPTAFSSFANINNTVIEEEIIPALRQVATNTGAAIIDTHAANANAKAHFDDGVHPSDTEGKKVLAEAVAQAVLQEVGN